MSDAVNQPEASQQSNNTPPNLQISDLVSVVQLISVVSQRGAIQPAEMTQVGGLYTRLVEFLESNGALTRTP